MTRWQTVADLHGDRFARFRVIRGFMREILEEYNPHTVVVESPFMHIRPESFATLREAMMVLRETAMDYYELMDFDLAAPMAAKKAVGAKSFTKGKEPVRDAVLALKDVDYAPGVDPRALDEHCIDSIAVAYWKARKILNEMHRR